MALRMRRSTGVRAVAVLAALALPACGALDGLTGGTDTSPPPDALPDAGGTDGGATDAASSDAAADASADVASTLDASGADADAGPCNLAADWGAPQAVPELNAFPTSAEYVGFTDVSKDQLTAYIGSNHGVQGLHIFYATRPSPTAAFGGLVLLFATTGDDWNATLTADGLTVVVSSDRNGHDDELYVSTRSSTFSAFGAASPVSALNGSTSNEQSPRFSPDGQSFYFDSDRSGDRELYVSAAAGGTFGAPKRITELGSSAIEAGPVLSADELTIYFFSNRPPATDGDIWMATRFSKTSPWEAPSRVTSLNSGAFDAPGALSADGCTFYLNSARDTNGPWRAYVARKPK